MAFSILSFIRTLIGRTSLNLPAYADTRSLAVCISAMSYPNLQFTKNAGLQNSFSLSKKRLNETPMITTPNLLDLQLNLPDPINRPTFSLVRGVKVPNVYTQPTVTYYHPPSQPLTKPQHPPKQQVTPPPINMYILFSPLVLHQIMCYFSQIPFQTPLPHRQYTAPEFGSRQKLLIAANNAQTQSRPHSQHQPQRPNISSVQSIEEPKKRHEEKIIKYTRGQILVGMAIPVIISDNLIVFAASINLLV